MRSAVMADLPLLGRPGAALPGHRQRRHRCMPVHPDKQWKAFARAGYHHTVEIAIFPQGSCNGIRPRQSVGDADGVT